MTESRQFAWPAYLVSAALVVVPLSDVLTSLYPWRVLDPRWRFGAVGLVSSSLLIPTAGLLVALVTAAACDHRVARKIIGVVGIVASTIALAALLIFALDALQTRATVPQPMRLSFHVASTAAAIKTLIAGASLLAIGLAALRAGKARSSRVKQADVHLFAAGQPAAIRPRESTDQAT
jgi:hypothetical protein